MTVDDEDELLYGESSSIPFSSVKDTLELHQKTDKWVHSIVI